jgi:DNA polymerase V
LVETSLNIHDLVVKHPEATFFVRVEGDSMEGVGIFSGDVLVVDRAVTPTAGRIVVAAVEGGLVVKRLKVIAGQMLLASENPDYPDIALQENSDCYVWGVVVGSVRQF